MHMDRVWLHTIQLKPFNHKDNIAICRYCIEDDANLNQNLIATLQDEETESQRVCVRERERKDEYVLINALLHLNNNNHNL